ncbi:Gfo/Idh/MocA family oxidoreductase [uncultured Roseivirga sp.]|uniref:Gfo/Idh/MocA family protein n=1 Tax=uncultured Roseivirga sp. TaxID=543088 RepID=UPI0030DB0EF0|tara:strand:+ start:1419 stop:2327 length:909 start_codon:yes stop_codon:yes gene_type:complete
MKVLIMGLGSISKKHIAAIRRKFSDALIYALRSNESSDEHIDVNHIYSITQAPKDLDFCIISNPTSKHGESIKLLSTLKSPLLIEKPVLSSLEEIDELSLIINEASIPTYVGCNLRFHPVILRLKEEMDKRKPVEMNVYCGSYLPEWRPDQDYREVYSAKSALGGGVHLDLIHEIDYTIYLLGYPQTIESYKSKKSSLEIDSYDIAHYTLEYNRTSVFITLNYYRSEVKRQIECVWENDVWIADLIKGSIINEKGEVIFMKTFDSLETYSNQLDYFWTCIHEGKEPMNSFDEAAKILRMCLK